MRSAATRPVIVVVLLLGALLAGPLPAASAHTQLISTTPADGATVPAPLPSVSLTFSESIQPQFVRVALTTPSGQVPVGEAAVTTKAQTVTIQVPDAGPGGYQVVYRVVSSDGHPVSGTLRYTVAGQPTASASATSASAASASASSASATSASATSASATSASATSASAAPSSAAPSSASGSGSSGAGGTSTGKALGMLAVLVAAGVAIVGAARRRREQKP